MSVSTSLRFKRLFERSGKLSAEVFYLIVIWQLFLLCVSEKLFINSQTLLQTSWCWGPGKSQQWFPCCCSWSPPMPSLCSSAGPLFYWGPVREPIQHHTPAELPEIPPFLPDSSPRGVTSAGPGTLGRSVEGFYRQFNKSIIQCKSLCLNSSLTRLEAPRTVSGFSMTISVVTCPSTASVMFSTVQLMAGSLILNQLSAYQPMRNHTYFLP